MDRYRQNGRAWGSKERKMNSRQSKSTERKEAIQEAIKESDMREKPNLYVSFFMPGTGKQSVLGPYVEVQMTPNYVHANKSWNETSVTIAMANQGVWTVVGDDGNLTSATTIYVKKGLDNH